MFKFAPSYHWLVVKVAFCSTRRSLSINSLFLPDAPPLDMSVDWLGFSYALLVSSGGVLGYVKAGLEIFIEVEIVYTVYSIKTLTCFVPFRKNNFFLTDIHMLE